MIRLPFIKRYVLGSNRSATQGQFDASVEGALGLNDLHDVVVIVRGTLVRQRHEHYAVCAIFLVL